MLGFGKLTRQVTKRPCVYESRVNPASGSNVKPPGRIVGISDKWSGKLPRYRLVGSEAAALLLPLEDDARAAAGALGDD